MCSEKSNIAMKFKMAHMLWISVFSVLALLDYSVRADYENTWNSYFEQPCCGNNNGQQHHLRHHKGNI